MENNPYVYNLSENIEYSKNGEFKTTAQLEFIGPNMATFDIASDLTQKVMQAFMDATSLRDVFKNVERPKADSNDEGLDAGAVKMILLQSKSVRFADVAKICKNLFTEVGTYDGSTKVKIAVLERLKIEDFTGAVCGYIANFIVPSLFSAEGD